MKNVITSEAFRITKQT